MATDRIEAAAAALRAQHEQGVSICALADDIVPRSVDEAYAVQDAFIASMEAQGETVVGWKVALTSAVMQQFVGIGEPCAGAIFASRVHDSNVTLQAQDYVNLGVESEIAVRIGADVNPGGAPYDRDSVAKHIAECRPAVELVDDRNWDYKKANAIELVADNSFNAGCVLGEATTNWQGLDLGALRAQMEINGEEVGEGVGADVLGHPFEPVAWLANHLFTRGRQLRRGDWVLTGSIVTTRWLSPGDEMGTRVDELGTARLRVQ